MSGPGGNRFWPVVEPGETTLLIVDDETDIRLLVRTICESARPDLKVVAEAVDGPEALAAFDRFDPPPVPHVVILDNRMPGVSGLEVAQEMLRRQPGQQIVLFTAHADQGVVKRAAELGIAAVVGKQDIASLPAVLRSLVV